MNIVVGGGIAGIVSAIFLAKKFGNTCLIEKDTDIGGLYRSIPCELGVTFDYGTHYIHQTGISEIDNIIFDGMSNDDWHILGNLKGGGYYAGTLNSSTHFLDARGLPENIYAKGILETLCIANEEKSFKNLDDQLRSEYGDTLTDFLFKPIIAGKYYGCDLNELVPGTHGLVGLGRVLAFTQEASREIKKSPVYDKRFAFHSYEEGVSDTKKFYPKIGGISAWIDLLKIKLKELNVSVITEANISEITAKKGTISCVELSNGKKLECSRLAWTASVPLFLRTAGLPLEKLKKPLKKLYTSLYHFVFDEAFLTDVHYIQCHDPNFKTFRVTLYPNIQSSTSGMYHLTVEVISPNPVDNVSMEKSIIEELKEMGVVALNATTLHAESESLANGFPFVTPELLIDMEKQMASAHSAFDNIFFFGRASGSNFRVGGILKDIFNTVEKMA